jgi:hypothetical protein
VTLMCADLELGHIPILDFGIRGIIGPTNIVSLHCYNVAMSKIYEIENGNNCTNRDGTARVALSIDIC